MSHHRPDDPSREPAWRRYLRFRGDDPRADVRDEIHFHLEGLVDELRARGMSEEDARAAALRRFGDVDRVAGTMASLAARRANDARRRAWMRGLRQDVVYAARSLRRTPLVSIAIIATLALGLATVSAVFSLLDQLYWRPPAGVADAGALRRVWTRQLQRWDGRRVARPSLSYPRYLALAESFGDRARFGLFMNDTTVRLGTGVHAPRVSLTLAERAYFDVLGVRLSHGRIWDVDDDRIMAPSPVAVVSERFAARHLDGASRAIGREIEVGGRRLTIVGVAAAPFAGVELQPTDVWAPLGEYTARPRMPGLRVWYEQPVFPTLRAVVRLASGTDPTSLETLGTARLRELEPTLMHGAGDSLVAMNLGSIVGVRGPGEVAAEVTVASRLGILALIMLAIACANVANLLLARAVQRRRELVLRVAIGASRARLIRLLTVESLLLGVPAALAAILAAAWLGGVLQARLLGDVIGVETTLHWRVAAFALVAAFAASWLTGIIPALQASRADPGETLKSGDRTSTAAQSRTRFTLTAAQLALSVALLASAGAFVSSLRRVQSLDLGIDAERIVTAFVEHDDRRTAPPDAVIARGLRETADALRGMPGVEAAALSVTRPMSGNWIIMQFFAGRDSLQSAGPDSDRWPALFLVSGDYFEATGMRFVRGRPFDAATPDGVVVNETMARLLWPGADALGACVQLERRTRPCRPVVGVVADARRSKVIEEARPQFYAPLEAKQADGWEPSALVLRVDPERRAEVMTALRARLAATFPAAAPNVQSLDATLAPQMRPWRLGAELFTALGLLGLVLSVIGVYANVAHQVSRRTRELGVRIALGARTADILRVIARTGMTPVVVGTAAGLLLALATGRLIEALLYGTSPYDPRVLGAVIVLLFAVSLLAMAGPALRARRVDPATVLRE